MAPTTAPAAKDPHCGLNGGLQLVVSTSASNERNRKATSADQGFGGISGLKCGVSRKAQEIATRATPWPNARRHAINKNVAAVTNISAVPVRIAQRVGPRSTTQRA